MSRKSKANEIVSVLISDVSKWWSWDDIMAKIIPGFSNIGEKFRRPIVQNYMTHLPHAYLVSDDNGRVVLRRNRAERAEFKIATTDDRRELEDRLVVLTDHIQAEKNRINVRVKNAKADHILPRSFTPAAIDDVPRRPEITSGE